jgi:hypothetical protein
MAHQSLVNLYVPIFLFFLVWLESCNLCDTYIQTDRSLGLNWQDAILVLQRSQKRWSRIMLRLLQNEPDSYLVLSSIGSLGFCRKDRRAITITSRKARTGARTEYTVRSACRSGPSQRERISTCNLQENDEYRLMWPGSMMRKIGRKTDP